MAKRTHPQIQHLHEGEMIHSRLPFHRLQKVIAAMADEGFRFRLDPSDTGYFVVCEVRPKSEQVA